MKYMLGEKEIDLSWAQGKKHKQISMTNPYTGETVSIDEGISELIKLLWEKEYFTIQCCEDVRGKIAISFASLCHLQNFLISLACIYNARNWDVHINSEPKTLRFPLKKFQTVVGIVQFPKSVYHRVLKRFKTGLNANILFPFDDKF